MKGKLGKLKRSRRQVALGGIVLILGVAAAFGGYTLVRKDKPVETKSSTITYSTDQPDENPPGKDFVWKGKPTDPKYITLPSINASGYIQNVGVDQNKAVAVPNNVHMAAWFVETVLPGEKGLSIIDGHVHGRVNAGIFQNLTKLKAGDSLTIEFGNGSKKDFEVVKSVSLDTKDAAGALFSQEPTITNQLNLITCSGSWDKKAQQYTQRTIVSTKLKGA